MHTPTCNLAEEALQLALDAAGAGTWDWNVQTGELVWSKQCLAMFGLPPDADMSYERFMQVVHPDDRERIDRAVKDALGRHAEYTQEMRTIWADGSVHWVLSRGRVFFNEAGQPVRMIGAGLDITKLKQTEEDLQRARSEARAQADNLAAILDAVPAITLIADDPKCESVTSSRLGYELAGLPRGVNISASAPPGQRNFRLMQNGREIAPDEAPLHRAAMTGREVRNLELQMCRPEGRSIDLLGNAVPLFDHAGKVRGAVGAFLDITERKTTEEALRASREELRLAKERFELALRSSPITVFTCGLDLRYKWVYNPRGGHGAPQLIGKRDSDVLDLPEDAALIEGVKSEVLRTGVSYQGEITAQIAGVPRTFYMSMDATRDAQCQIIGLTCAAFDLTEQKRAEAELERLAQQRRLALDAAELGWWHYDPATGIANWDERLGKIFGIDGDSGPAEKIVRMLHPEDQAKAWASLEKCVDLLDPEPQFAEYRVLRPDGSWRWVEAHGAAEFEGKGDRRRVVSCVGTVQDVTERKAADEALQQQRARFEFVAEGSDVGFWFCDLPLDKIIWDKRVKNHFWLPPDDSVVTMAIFYSLLHPDDREPTRRAIENSINHHEQYDVEYRTVAPDGLEKWVRANGRAFYDESGKPVRFDGITQDITARKRAQAALRASEERYRTLFETMAEGFVLCELVRDEQGRAVDIRWLECNPALERLTGLSRDQVVGHCASQIFPDEWEWWVRIYEGVVKEKKVYRFEHGSESAGRTWDLIAFPHEGDRFAVLYDDITARKQAEAQLLQSQKTFSDLVERAPFGIFIIDSDFRIAQMNMGSQNGAFRNVRPVIGRDFSEAIRIVWPEPVAEEVISVFRHTLETGEPYYSSSFKSTRNDTGAAESYEWESHRIALPNGQNGVLCYYFDSTQLRQAEESVRESEARYRELARNLDREVQLRTLELQRRTEQVIRASDDLRELSGRVLRVQDEERRRIARELHDSAGQILTALGLELGSLTEDVLKAAPQLAGSFAGAQDLVQQLHREIRTTSYLLHPPLLDEAGLSSALSWYVEGLSQRSGIEIDLKVPDDFGRLPRDMELVMFRLVQESMTNIHRHSGSRTAEIRVAREDGMVTIAVRDRGRGMPPEELKKIREGGSGVGIRGMRERLRQFQGELRIESDESGTQVLVKIPIPQRTVHFPEPLQPAV